MTNFIPNLVSLILFLGMTGGLVDLTKSMMDKSAKAHQMGLISLSQLNRALVGNSAKPSKNVGSKTKENRVNF